MKLPEPMLPPLFLERLKKILSPSNFEAYLNSLSLPMLTSFRINTLKTSIPTLLTKLKEYGISPEPISWCQAGYFIQEEKRRLLTETSLFQDGLIYIQNAASLFASLVLAPQPGEEILDLAAAPGGKTLHIAALMKNEGRIAAVEAVKERFFRLHANIKQADAKIVQVYHKDGANIGRLVPNRFDRVLLDAPCSSEGRFKIDKPSTSAFWSEKKIQEMSRKQKRLIYSAIESLKRNGILVYCTCSFAPEENEAIIDYVLQKFPNRLEVLPITVPFSNYQPGLSSWQKKNFSPAVSKAIRIIPNALMNGFFICKLRKIV